MADNTTGEIVSDADALATGHTSPSLWLKKIKRAQEDEKEWREKAREAVQIYEAADGKNGGGVPAFNILHSNIEITVPSLYNSTPIPDVRRRFGDIDPDAKLAVDVIERSLSYFVDQYDFDGTMIEATRDAELTGRGCVRVRYKPTVQTQEDPATGETYETVSYQEVTCEHVVWDKWGHGPCRHWGEVPWVYFEHDLTNDDLKALGVSEERIKALSFSDHDEKSGGDGGEKASTGVLKTVRAYEVWNKADRKVYFVAEQDKDEFLSATDDPLRLEQFFPVTKPMQPLRRRSDLTPIVPYDIYRVQVAELDRVTKRINGLVSQLRVRGLYDKRLGADLERLRFCEDGQYEPADDATVFAQGSGGLANAIAHWPLGEIVKALQQLYIQRDQIKQTIYEITGLSDVLRGATNPNETLGAQQLKAQQGSTRLSQRQRMVAEMCRQVFRMKSELIANHFTPENLIAITSVRLTPAAEQILRSDLMRAYRIDIESDSTVRADLARSQEQMGLFLQGTAQYASAMAPILQTEPGAKAPILQIYAAFARHFKLGKSAEDALDSMIEAAQQPQEPQPSPEQQKMEMEKQRLRMQAEMDQQKQQADMQKITAELEIKQQLAGIEMQMKQLDLQVAERKAEIELQKAQMEIGLKQQAMELDREAKIYDIETKREMSQLDIASRRDKAAADSEARHEKAELAREREDGIA